MKLTSLHALTHDHDLDHPIHCLVCDHAIVNDQLTPIFPNSAGNFEFTEPIVFFDNKIVTEYLFGFYARGIHPHLFSRPPPIS
ncbi:MAG: hypothetical protein ACK5NB_14055 [Flavobacteriaceae bacterium]